MDLRQIKNIIKEFEDSTIDKLEIADSEFTIKLEKNTNKASNNLHNLSASPTVSSAAVATLVAPAQETTVEEQKEDTVEVKAPLVGTFYQAPSPDASPFVAVNQKVTKGDTLFIVEAMKVMNEVVAPVSGTVVKINVSDASMVEFGQVIMEIKE